MRTKIRGRSGETIGYITESTGRRTISDSGGNTLGWYITHVNQTFDYHGRMIGYGDQLSILLKRDNDY